MNNFELFALVIVMFFVVFVVAIGHATDTNSTGRNRGNMMTGTCPDCGRRFGLRRDGRYPRHKPDVDRDGPDCPRSLTPYVWSKTEWRVLMVLVMAAVLWVFYKFY